MNEQEQILALKKRNRWLLFGLGGVTLAAAAFFLLLAGGPVVGQTFSTVNEAIGRMPPYAMPAATDAPALEAAISYDTLSPQLPQPVERLIIRDGYLTLTVEDTLAAQKEVEKIVGELKAEGAFIVSQEARASGEGVSPYVDMVIRVPAAKFDEVMDRIEKLAVRVDQRSETAQDVTEEYVDLTARLESLEAARDRLLNLMKNAATTEELLLAEQQLTQREAEIESLKGRVKYLTESARLSSITINLQPYRPSQPLDNTWRPAETFRGAVETLLNSLRGFADFLIVFVVAILPWLAVIGLIVWVVVRVIRKRRINARRSD